MILDPNETIGERLRHSFKSIGTLGFALVFFNTIGFVFGLLTQGSDCFWQSQFGFSKL